MVACIIDKTQSCSAYRSGNKKCKQCVFSSILDMASVCFKPRWQSTKCVQ